MFPEVSTVIPSTASDQAHCEYALCTKSKFALESNFKINPSGPPEDPDEFELDDKLETPTPGLKSIVPVNSPAQ